MMVKSPDNQQHITYVGTSANIQQHATIYVTDPPYRETSISLEKFYGDANASPGRYLIIVKIPKIKNCHAKA
jgi:hypothetical protein